MERKTQDFAINTIANSIEPLDNTGNDRTKHLLHVFATTYNKVMMDKYPTLVGDSVFGEYAEVKQWPTPAVDCHVAAINAVLNALANETEKKDTAV